MSFIFFTFDLSLSVAGCYFPQDGASLETIKCGSVREKMQTYPFLHQAYHSFCRCHFTVQMIKTLHGPQGPQLSHSKSQRGEDSLQKIGYKHNVNCHTNYYKIIGSPGITQRQTNLPQFDCPKRTIILHVYMSTASNFGAVTEEMVVSGKAKT